METTPVKKRLAHIDLLKCLAIYLVLVFHGTLYDYFVYPDMSAARVLRFLFRSILSTCVPLFFFANGYLLLSRPMSLRRHTVRTVKLMLQTCFWMIFLLFALQPYYQEYFTWEELKGNLWDLKDGWNNQLWFMEDLIAIYLLVPLLKRTWDADKKSFCWFTGVMAVLVFGNDLLDLGVTLFNLFVKKEFYLYQNNLPVFYNFTPFAWDFPMGLAYFCLGGVACLGEERLQKIPARWRNLGAAVGLVLCCTMLGVIGWRFSLYQGWIWDVVWNGYDTVFTLGSVLCLYVLCLNLKKEIPLVRLISANTLGIYLIHDLVHKSLGTLAIEYEAMRTLPGTLLHSTVVLFVSLGICLVLKKIPLVKHLVS